MIKPVKAGNKTIFFENLDGLRFVAFFLVFLQHTFLNAFLTLPVKNSFFEQLLLTLFSGATGVSIFFVLSGYLITYLLLKELSNTGKINVPFFYMRRVLRIWPLYFLVLFFGIIVYPALKSLIGIDTLMVYRPYFYFTFLSNFEAIRMAIYHAGAEVLSVNITWSVAIEEQFYIVWPLLFVFTPKKFYPYIFIFIIVCSTAFRWFHQGEEAVLYFHTLSVCSDLAMGGLFAWLSLHSSRFLQFFKTLRKQTIAGVYLAGLFLLMVTKQLPSVYTDVFSRLTATLFFAFVICEQNFSLSSVYKFSSAKVLSFWGKYTYGLYLLHPIAILIIDIGMRILHLNYKENFYSYFASGIGVLILSLALSYLSYEYFEKKFLRIKSVFSPLASRKASLVPVKNNAVDDTVISNPEK